jgi:hypothetical protein
MAQARLCGFFAVALVVALFVAGCGCGDSSDTTGATVTSGEAQAEKGGTALSDRAAADAGSEKMLRKAEEFGSEATGSDAEQVEAALLGYLGAQANGEWAAACSYLTEALRRAYAHFAHVAGAHRGCPGFMAPFTRRLPPAERASLADVEVRSVRLKDRDGYVIYVDGSGTTISKPVEREGGEWKLSSVLVKLLERARSAR